MNGRVYDPNIGRFISADPTIQAPFLSQSLNRYSYVMNNPLSLIDPSGYSWLSKQLHSIGHFLSKWGATIIALAATALGQPWYLIALYTSTYTSLVNGGNALKNLARAEATAGAFYAAGSLGEQLKWFPGSVGHAALHAAAGCLSGLAGGGGCGQGAMSAAFADYAQGNLPAVENEFLGAGEAGLLGGIASTLGGGRFEQGFEVGVAGYLFNEGAHELFLKIQVKKLVEIGYSIDPDSLDGRFSAAFKPKEGFSIGYEDGQAVIEQNHNYWKFDASGLKGAGAILGVAVKEITELNVNVGANTDGTLELSGSFTFKSWRVFGFTLGGTVKVPAVNAVMESSGLLGIAARDLKNNWNAIDEAIERGSH